MNMNASVSQNVYMEISCENSEEAHGREAIY